MPRRLRRVRDEAAASGGDLACLLSYVGSEHLIEEKPRLPLSHRRHVDVQPVGAWGLKGVQTSAGEACPCSGVEALISVVQRQSPSHSFLSQPYWRRESGVSARGVFRGVFPRTSIEQEVLTAPLQRMEPHWRLPCFLMVFRCFLSIKKGLSFCR
jgi:hypothetical protein